MARGIRFFFLFSVVIAFGAFPVLASAATIYSNSATGNDSTGDGSSGAPYATFHKAYTVSSANDTIDLTGTFDWSTATETGDAATTGYTIGKNLTIAGHGATTTIIQATSTVGTTATRRVFTISTANTVTIQDLTVRYGRVTGGSDYGGGIYNQGTTTVQRVSVSNNYSGGYGGGIAHGDPTNGGSLTVRDSTIINNTGVSQGGGLYSIITTTGPMHVINSTVAFNIQQASSATVGGGGVAYRGGSGTITNSTIAYNNLQNAGTADGAGVWFVSGSSNTLEIKNSIVTNNYAQGVALGSSQYDVDEDSGIITDNGYNIFGRYTTSHFATTSTTWVDQQGSGTLDGSYTKTGTAASSLSLSDGLAYNDSLQGTQTLAIASTTSIAIDNGSTDANGVTAIPTADQRNASRSGSTDIGAFEVAGGGLTVVAPTTQASAVTFSTLEYKRMTVSWTAGNGSRRVVFMKQANTGTASPVNGTMYSATSTFGSGNQIGSSGWYAIADTASSTSVTVTNLTPSTDYIVQVFEYNGVGSGSAGDETYFTDTASGNPATQATYTPITRYANSATGNDTTGDGTSGTPYATFHKLYTVAQQGDTLNIAGTFTWTDSGETGDAATSGYTLAKDLTIVGQSATSTIIQASSTAATADRRVFTTTTGLTLTFRDLTIRYGKLTGGSAGGGILNQGTTTLERVAVSYNTAGTGGGGGIWHADTTGGGSLTIIGSTIDNNTTGGQGGGVGTTFNVTGPVNITNSTIAFNTMSASSATVGGGGVSYRGGSGTITNSTIAYNNLSNGGTANGAGLWSSQSSASDSVKLKNTIIVNNYLQGGALTDSIYDIYKGSSGVYTDNGYNIFGRFSTSQVATTSTTWADEEGSGTLDSMYTKTGTAATALNLASSLAYNNSLYGTQTLAITLAGSIAIDNGSTDANGTIAIPSNDQRNGTRSGATDIGSFELGAGGLTDTTAPTASISAPSASAAVKGASVSITASAGDETAVSGVKFYIDDVLTGSEDTSSPYSISWDSTAVAEGSHTVYAVARDSSTNFATSSSVSFTVDNTVPTVSLTAPANGATVGGSAVTLSASASDTATLSGVKFYVNGTLQGSEDTSSPFSISWNSTATTSGSKIIVAVARDSASNYATSTSVTVTTDNTAPTASTLFPADNASTATATTTLAITFSENVTAVSGKNIVVKKSSDNSTVQTIAANDTSKVAISGVYATTTIDVLGDGLGYYVQIDSGAFVDVATNAYTGISNTTSWNFTTRDINPPTVSSFSPADNGSGVSATANLVIVFSETITAVAAKNIVIKKSSDNSTIETIAANNTSLVTVSSATVTINPAATLSAATAYYVQIDSGAFKDAANLNYTGIADTATWNFTIADVGAPSVTLTLPANGATIGGSAIGMSATASDDVAVAGVKFYVNNILAGPEDTSSPYSFVWNSLATTSGQKVVVAVARDTSNNYATSTSATVTLGNQPTPSSVTASSTRTGGAVTWTTPYEGSSKMYFGLVSATGSSTPEANTGSGVTSHSVNLSGLPPCTVYKYVTVSKTEGGDVATSSQSTLKTAGCTGSATILSNSEGAITTAGGGSLTEGALTLTVPTSFTNSASSATFQANKLDGSTFFSTINPPTGKNTVGTGVYNLKALTDESSTISSFSAALSVTLEYEDADVADIDESTLKIHRYDSDWNELSNCSVDTAANTVTCTTTNFSDFAIFGDEASSSSSSSSSSVRGGGVIGGPLGIGYRAPTPSSISVPVTSSKKFLFTRNLRSGSVGEDVRQLQILLNAKGFVITKKGPGAPGEESTTFGPRTRTALIKFQEAYAREILTPFNLKKGTGIFATQTRKVMNALIAP